MAAETDYNHELMFEGFCKAQSKILKKIVGSLLLMIVYCIFHAPAS